VASGRVAPLEALVSGSFALVLALGLSWLSGSTVAVGLVVTYVALNAAYSLGAKHVPLIDVFLLSSGFVLRVLLGCALIGVRPSSWLLLCSSALALFLALAKRRGDLVRGVGPDHRPSLKGYNIGFLDQAMTISTALTLMSYALYTVEADVLLPGREFASLPFVLFGVLEYLRLVYIDDEGASPVDVILSSPKLLLSGVGWAVATAWSLGLL
jgi:4-hydroxybenzoate polyprenyltransferase